MKKNILTIIILATSLINIILSAVIIFSIVPTANRTNTLVSKVASIIDLELESPTAETKISISDISTYDIDGKLTINMKSKDINKYATLYVSLSINTKHKDSEKLQSKIKEHELAIKEIVQNEFSKYSSEEANANKDEIKKQVLANIQEYFDSDFIINVTFADLVFS